MLIIPIYIAFVLNIYKKQIWNYIMLQHSTNRDPSHQLQGKGRKHTLGDPEGFTRNRRKIWKIAFENRNEERLYSSSFDVLATAE